ncbi:hypothetical protein B0H19DRAFT_1259512 [Mycena capillaripes]|nr:hypothetical protein B0H19DRAFT_1259512 [Mycena capillaripes]
MSTSDSSNPLKVSIVGAGIAGLTAAIALRRNGHLVQIFEASEIKTEIGAGLGVSPNSARVLNHLGVCRDNLKGTLFSGSVSFDVKTGEGKEGSWSTPSVNENPAFFVHRSDLYEELRRLVTGDGEGPPVNLRLGSKVLECDPEEGAITLNSGEVVQADLILGADGIHSVIRTHVVGSVQNASPSGWSCFRAVFEPTVALSEIPELQWFTSGPSGTRTVLAQDGQFRMLLFYPMRSGTLINFVGFFPDSQDAAGEWTPTASREDIVAQFHDFHPKFLRIFDLPTHSEMLKWKLRVLPLLPTWIHGRAGLVGDAAHGTLPLLGMGAAMAIEEGGALGCLFPAGTRREDVPARLQAYQDIRKTRGDFVRTQSVEQVSRLVHSDPTQFLVAQKMQSYLMEYDAIGVAQQCYDERFGAKSVST